MTTEGNAAMGVGLLLLGVGLFLREVVLDGFLCLLREPEE